MDKQNLKEKLYTGQKNEQENESQQEIQYKISISSENDKDKLPKMNQNRQINLDIKQHSDQKSIVEISEKSSNQVQSKFSSFLSKNKSKFSDKIQNQSKNINPSQIQNRSQNRSQQKKIELKNEGTKIINPNLLDIEDNLLTLQKRLNEVYINPNINKIDTFLYKQDQIISNRPRKKSMYSKKQDIDDQYLANDQNKSIDKNKFYYKNQNSNQLNIQQNEKFQQRKLSKQNKNLIQNQQNQQQNKKLDLNQIQNKKASIKSIQQLQEALKGLEGYQNNISPTQKKEQKPLIVKEEKKEDQKQLNIEQLNQLNEKKIGIFEKWEQIDKSQKKKKLFESEISENTLNENFIQNQQTEQDFQILNDKKDKKQQLHTQILETEVYQDKQQQQYQQDQQKNEYQEQQDENQNDESFSGEESDIENYQKKKKSQFNDEACQQHANVIFDDVQVENIFFPYQVPADIEFAKKHQKAQYFGIPNTYGDKCKCCQQLVKVNKYSIWETQVFNVLYKQTEIVNTAFFGITKMLTILLIIIFFIYGIYLLIRLYSVCNEIEYCLNFIFPTLIDTKVWSESSTAQNRALLYLEFFSLAIFQSAPLFVSNYLEKISKYQQMVQQQHQITKKYQNMNCLLAKHLPPGIKPQELYNYFQEIVPQIEIKKIFIIKDTHKYKQLYEIYKNNNLRCLQLRLRKDKKGFMGAFKRLEKSKEKLFKYLKKYNYKLPQGHKAFIFLNSHDDAIVLQHFYQKNKVKVNKMMSTFKNIFKIEQLDKNDISVTFPPGLYTDIMWNKIGIPLKYKSIRRLAIYGTIGIIIIVIDVLAFKFIQQKILYEIEYYFEQMNGKDGENFDISQYIDSLLQQTYFSIIYFMMGQICISSGSLLMKRVLNTTHSLDVIQGIQIEIIIHLVYYIIFPYIMFRIMLSEPNDLQLNQEITALVYKNVFLQLLIKSAFWNQILSFLSACIDFRVIIYLFKLKLYSNKTLTLMTQVQLNQLFTPPTFNLDKYIIALLQIYSIQILSFTFTPFNIMVGVFLQIALYYVTKFYIFRFTKQDDLSLNILKNTAKGFTMQIITFTSLAVYIITKIDYIKMENQEGDKTNSLLTEQMVMVVILFVLQLIYLLKPKIEKLRSDRQYKKYVKQLAALRIRQPISDNKYIKEDVYYNSYLKYIQNFDPYFVELINKEMRFQALKYEIQKASKKKSKKKNSKEKITQLKALQMEEIQKEIQEKVQNQIEKPKKLVDIHNLTQKLTTDALNESIIDCSKNNINPNSSPLRQQSINFEIENLQIKLEDGISEDINKDIEEINLEEFQQKIQNDELDESFLQGENFENKINELNHKLKLEKIESNYLTEYQRLEQIYQNLQQLRISVQNRFPLLNNDHFKSEINSNDNSIFPNDSDLLDSQKIKSPQNYQQYLQQQQDLEQEEDLTESQTEFKKFIKFFLGRSSPQKRKPKILNEQIRKRDIDIKNADLSLSQVSQPNNNNENFSKNKNNSNNLSLFSLIKSKLSGENQQENQQIEKSQKLSKSGLNSKVQENVQENKNRRKSLELKTNELQQQFLKDKQIFS